MWSKLRKNQYSKEEFEDFLLQNMDSMYNLAYRLTGNREEAADLVQEASLRAYRFFYQFQQGTSFKSWILTIVRNIFINQYRKKVKEPYMTNYDDIKQFVSFSDDSEFGEEIFGEELQISIDQLPETMKTALILFYVEKLSYKEIAQVMKCPIGTVMSRLSTARNMLKDKLQRKVKSRV